MTEVELGSGNLWADVGRADADEAFARARLMRRIGAAIRETEFTVPLLAEALNVDGGTAQDLIRGKLSRFSLERLIAFLNALDCDVEITVRRRPAGSDRPARVTVAGD